MTVVVDASVALSWVLQEERTNAALGLWDRWQAASEDVIAPPIFRSEITNVIHRQVRRGKIDSQDGVEMVDVLVSAVTPREPSGLYTRALLIAREFSLAYAYGALYLALAESEGCDVWTADLQFHRAVGEEFPRVRTIGGAPPRS